MENVGLLIMDMQNDFCNGYPMSNTKSLKIIPIINKLRNEFKYIFLTRELHQKNHSSFKNYGGKYLAHCIEGTEGAEFHEHLDRNDNDMIITRGTLQKYDSGSAFYDADEIGKPTNLRDLLKLNGIKKIYFCGLNMDTSLFSTIMDAINFKYECHVYSDAIGYIDEEKYMEKIDYLTKLGINFI